MGRIKVVAKKKSASKGNIEKSAGKVFQAEGIRGKRVDKGVLKFLVKWEGFPESENTWEPATELVHLKEWITEFETAVSRMKKKKADVGKKQSRKTTRNSEKERSKKVNLKVKTSTAAFVEVSQKKKSADSDSSISGSIKDGTVEDLERDKKHLLKVAGLIMQKNDSNPNVVLHFRQTATPPTATPPTATPPREWVKFFKLEVVKEILPKVFLEYLLTFLSVAVYPFVPSPPTGTP